MKKKSFLAAMKVYRARINEECPSKDIEAAFDLIIKEIGKLPEEGSKGASLFEIKQNFSLPSVVSNANDVAIFSDGACRGNPGPGSYGVIAQDQRGEMIFERVAVEEDTTNNRMELLGAIVGLETAIEMELTKGQIYLYSDSKYVVDGINKWVSGWKKRNWKKADKKDPENLDLWKRLDQVCEEVGNVSFHWVKGHAGHPQNEYCDTLANRELDSAGF
jgi:ribonuclease HI